MIVEDSLNLYLWADPASRALSDFKSLSLIVVLAFAQSQNPDINLL